MESKEAKKQSEIEGVAGNFALGELFVAREKTWRAVREIAAAVRPGMKESQAVIQAAQIMKAMGAIRHWHRPNVRFGTNTLVPAGLPSPSDPVLQETDIFFIDIGPVWENGYEGDCGDTFTVGGLEGLGGHPDHVRCASDARLLFKEVAEHWRTHRAVGTALYEFAAEKAREKGWNLTLERSQGHRISEFPHSFYFKGSLGEQSFAAQSNRWVLEILIRHPSLPYGAFFEDILFSPEIA